VAAAVADLTERRAGPRMWSGDHTLWQDDPTEVADRLGWLHVVDDMAAALPEIERVAAAAAADGLRHAVVLGMGGSSLFPEVLARSFPPARLDLRALDTTDPAAIARIAELGLDRCLFVAASKSGTTIETRSQLEHFWAACGPIAGGTESGANRGSRFVAITDPGSELAELARQRGFRATFENRADIGGRYSALSHFGIVPGALMGVDVVGLLQRAQAVAAAHGPSDHDHPAVRLGAILGAGARAGRDKLTLVLPEGIATFGLWLEQLVAESTGKAGEGIVPVTGEPLAGPEAYGDDRLFVAVGDDHRATLDALAAAGHPVVTLAYGDPLDLGGLVLLWEQAVALSGAVLGINPFDQPDVAAAKEATATVLDEGLSDIPTTAVSDLLDLVGPGDHLAVQAFVDPGDIDLLTALEATRVALRDRLRVATTVGIGPRFLHSTGQLHKGGPPSGVFLQVVGDDPSDLDIPGRGFGFSTLKNAQAAGDLRALQDRGLRAGRVGLDELLAAR
ncbi:MAG TPA: hypothetical protein VMN58_03145, partial [Acidimicrobiales bacterium]|nr:hypothetical protein [Acidimicrobiales bacterium]